MITATSSYKLLIREYDKKRMEAASLKKEREEAIYRQIPDIEKIDRSISQLGIRLIRQSLAQPGIDLEALSKKETEDLVRRKKQLLVEYNYPVDYLDLQHDCPICKDTGFITPEPSMGENDVMYFKPPTTCKCFEQALIDVAYNQSNLKHVLATENFNTFRFDVYSDEIDPVKKKSPRTNMRGLYDKAVGFTEYFDSRKENLLFLGPTGLGKTFLCNCIAREILDKGYSVLYLTAQELFSLFEESRFHREDMEDDSKDILDNLFSSDLLIIDDFGTEVQNSFTAPDLFHIINSRALSKSPTIISTNLSSKELQNLYSERIVSRLFGNYTVCRVFGEDIRLQKLRKMPR